MNKKVFLSTELIIYMLFLAMDLTNQSSGLSSIIKYSGIILCFFYACLYRGEGHEKKESWSVRFALLFTMAADYCLLLNEKILTGVLFFIIVQMGYLYRMCEGIEYGKRIAYRLVGSCLILGVLYVFKVPMDMVVPAVCFYFLSLVDNTILSFVQKRKVFSVGMALFVMCDINVGFFNLSSYVLVENTVFAKLIGLSSILMWVFYLPSQTLIAVSVEEKRM